MLLNWWKKITKFFDEFWLTENERYVYSVYKKIKQENGIYFPKNYEELKCLDKWKKPLQNIVDLSKYKWEAFWKYVNCKWYKK